MLCILMMLTFLVVLITMSSREKGVDSIGTVGGLLGGFFLTMAAAPPVMEGGSYERKCRIFGWSFATIQLLITLLMLMLVVS
jgi:hypothetical protein